jgi:hypothetical protein
MHAKLALQNLRPPCRFHLPCGSWVRLAEEAGVDAGEMFAIRFVTRESKLTDESQILAAAERKVVKGRIDRLEDFKKAATLLKADLTRRLRKPTKKRTAKRQRRAAR